MRFLNRNPVTDEGMFDSIIAVDTYSNLMNNPERFNALLGSFGGKSIDKIKYHVERHPGAPIILVYGNDVAPSMGQETAYMGIHVCFLVDTQCPTIAKSVIETAYKRIQEVIEKYKGTILSRKLYESIDSNPFLFPISDIWEDEEEKKSNAV